MAMGFRSTPARPPPRARLPPPARHEAAEGSMSELRDECGVAAIYHLPGEDVSPLCTEHGPDQISRLMPRMLLDIQNRGQLAAGMTTYDPARANLLETL